MKQKTIAKKLNLSDAFFSLLLSGSRNIGSVEDAKKIQKILNHNAHYSIWLRDGGTPEQRQKACRIRKKY
jgi:transcriptional regulator with XRE-family HTH domain